MKRARHTVTIMPVKTEEVEDTTTSQQITNGGGKTAGAASEGVTAGHRKSKVQSNCGPATSESRLVSPTSCDTKHPASSLPSGISNCHIDRDTVSTADMTESTLRVEASVITG